MRGVQIILFIVFMVFSGGSCRGEELGELLRVLEGGSREEARYAAGRIWEFGEGGVTRLAELLASERSPSEVRVHILEMLSVRGRERPIEACELARLVLRSESAELRAEGRRTLVAIDELPRARPVRTIEKSSYSFLRDRITELREAGQAEDLQEALECLEVLKAKAEPMLATRVLLDLLSRSSLPLESEIRGALELVTGSRGEKDWEQWFERESRRSAEIWFWRRLEAERRRHEEERAALERAGLDLLGKTLRALRGQDESCLKELSEILLHSPVGVLREAAARELGALAARCAGLRGRILLELRRGITAAPEGVRRECLRALGACAQEDALEFLIPAIGESRGLSRAALEALGQLGLPSAAEAVRGRCEEVMRGKSLDVEWLQAAFAALERMGRDRGGAVSSLLLRVPGVLARSDLGEHERVRLKKGVAAALGRLEYESEAAARAAAAGLAELSRDAMSDVRFYSADALSRLPFVDCHKELEVLIRDPESSVRQAAIRGLGRWTLRPELSAEQRRRAIALLCDALVGADESLSEAARASLMSLAADDRSEDLSQVLLITEALLQRQQLVRALPFLEGLPARSARYEARRRWLLLRRFEGRLLEAEVVAVERRGAVLGQARADLEKLESEGELPVWRARLQLASGRFKEAAQVLGACLDGDPEAWTSWRRAIQKLSESEPESARGLLREVPREKLSASQRSELEKLEQGMREAPATPSAPDSLPRPSPSPSSSPAPGAPR